MVQRWFVAHLRLGYSCRSSRKRRIAVHLRFFLGERTVEILLNIVPASAELLYF